MAITDWDIVKTTLVCAASGREFAEDEEIYSALYDEDSQFVRRDYAAEHWPPKDVDRVFSFWKTRTPKKDGPVKRFVDDDVIADFFARLEGQSGEQKRNFRYVLALFLMRRKRLKFKEMRRVGNGMVMVVHERLTDRDHEVQDPRLSEEQIAQVSGEIGRILNTRI